MEKTEFLLQSIQQLRDEIVSTQKIRAQIIGFKLTYVTAGIGYIFSQNLSPLLLILVAFGAILFDFLITGQSISIKRAGFYMRTRVGPVLRTEHLWMKDYQFWEEFMTEKPERGSYSTLGNLGQTILVFLLALSSPFFTHNTDKWHWNEWNIIGTCIAIAVLCYFMKQDIRFYRTPSKFNTQKDPNFSSTLWKDIKWLWKTFRDV